MKTYSVITRFIFDGVFIINAENRQEARKLVNECCGMVSKNGIHTSCDEKVRDWKFPVHPEKMIISVITRKVKNKKQIE